MPKIAIQNALVFDGEALKGRDHGVELDDYGRSGVSTVLDMGSHGDVSELRQAVLDKLADITGEHGKKSVAHAAEYRVLERALSASSDVITLVPMKRPADHEIAQNLTRKIHPRRPDNGHDGERSQ
ncbi:hypothetical protein DL769_010750 [Monosporascus sp. CRB-8-3]|nr:hypothetical protein DL769_010750 [Monosporascus sp. CRB-8-3]